MQTSLASPVSSLPPRHCSAPFTEHPQPPSSRPVLPRTLSFPLPSPPGRTYGTHFAGDIEEPPVRPPSAMAPRRSRASLCPASVAASLAWQLGHLSEPRLQLCSWLAQRMGIPSFSGEGRPE